jgi:hypothetical protein
MKTKTIKKKSKYKKIKKRKIRIAKKEKINNELKE